MSKAIKAAGRVLKAIACKTVCGKPPANSVPGLTQEAWDKWAAPLVHRSDDFEYGVPTLTIFNPGSVIPVGFSVRYASPDPANDTAVFEVNGFDLRGNLTGYNATAIGVQYGNFSVVNNVFEEGFGDQISIDETVPESVKNTIRWVDYAVDHDVVTYEELEAKLDGVRALKSY